MKNIIIYTDGSALKNPGRGGWGAILMYGDITKEISGCAQNSTNNQMELTAVIEALKCLKEPCNVELYSDSAYVINAFEQGWIENWIKNNWKTSTKKAVLNDTLWKELIKLVSIHHVHFNKVKGHSDNEFNNRCDELARTKAATLPEI